MEPSKADQLVEFVERRAGPYFRGLAWYDRAGAELLHCRDDLDERAMEDRVEELHWAIRPRSDFDALDELGAPAATIQLREEAVIVNFPLRSKQGYLIGLEPGAARNLHEFVDECLERIQALDR